jgi:hypothetical protein
MGIAGWMRVLDTVTGLAQAGARFRRAVTGTDLQTAPGAATGPIAALETRLAGVVVAALKEAFDRDKARLDLERETLEAERLRAERALQAELRRQAADRALTQLKLIAMFSGGMLLTSGILSAWIAGMRDGSAAVTLACGWAAGLGALGCVFAAWPRVSAIATSPAAESQSPATVSIAPWLLLASLALTAASLLIA